MVPFNKLSSYHPGIHLLDDMPCGSFTGRWLSSPLPNRLMLAPIPALADLIMSFAQL